MEEFSVNIRKTTMVQPSQESSRMRLWLSNPDLTVKRAYVQCMYFYRAKAPSPGFFDPNPVKEALSRALIPFYPAAGRLRMDTDGKRIEIDCNDEGALFVEAETSSVLDDFGDFAPTIEYDKMIPNIDSSNDISSHPLLLLQLTYFKCGGVALGVGIHHMLADGFSVVSFLNSWAALAKGLGLSTSPWIDRTLLRARNPPTPKFKHVEFDPSLSKFAPRPTSVTLSTRSLNVTDDLIRALRANSMVEGSNPEKHYSSFEMLSGHIWRCVCKARGLSDTQQSKLYIPVDARSRLEPKLPPMYFGNAVLMATPAALAGDLVSNPASYAACKIRESVAKMDNEYIRSAIDYIELHPDKESLVRGPHTFHSPNLIITSWGKLPIYDADFGWGRPTFTGPGWVGNKGCHCYLVPRTGSTDGGLSLVITLEAHQMESFQTDFYHI